MTSSKTYGFLYTTLTIGVLGIMLFLIIPSESKSFTFQTTNQRNSYDVVQKRATRYPTIQQQPQYRPHSNLRTKITQIRPEKRQEESLSTPTNILDASFNSGFKRFFEFLRKAFSPSRSEDETPGNESEGEHIKFPGLPTTSIFNSYNLTSLIRLLENSDETQVEFLTESAIVDTISQLVAIVGVHDLRDWLGIILMYFILGPIMIPLFWLPISLLGMAGLLVPLFYFNPPSKLNTNVMGHDPIKPESERAAGERKFAESFALEDLVDKLSRRSSSVSNATHHDSNVLKGCINKVICQLESVRGNNLISKWMTSRFNITKVERARLDFKNEEKQLSHNCANFTCSVLPAIANFIASWNNSVGA